MFSPLAYRVVNPSVFILDICGVSLGPIGDFPGNIRDFDHRIQVQSVAPPLVGIPSKDIVPQLPVFINEKCPFRLDFIGSAGIFSRPGFLVGNRFSRKCSGI